MERLFQERGLPRSIRSDNGVPFASANSLFQLSKLSVGYVDLEERTLQPLDNPFGPKVM